MKKNMNKTRMMALLCALVMLTSLLPAVAGADTIKYIKTSTGESVNMHSSQEFGTANVVGHVPYSGKVTVISDNGTWAYINYNKANGYVLSNFLVNGEPIKKGVTSPSTTYTMYAKTTNKADLNMRSSMTTRRSDNIVGHVPYGKKVTVLSTHGSWCYIKYGSVKGYVLKSLLSSKSPTIKTVVTSSITSGSTCYITSANKKSVNFRSTAAKKKGNIIKALPYGTKVTAYESSDGWTRIKYGKKTGYVQTSFLSKTNPKKK